MKVRLFFEGLALVFTLQTTHNKVLPNVVGAYFPSVIYKQENAVQSVEETVPL